MTAPAHTDLLTGQGAYREYLTRTARSLYGAARTEQTLVLGDVDLVLSGRRALLDLLVAVHADVTGLAPSNTVPLRTTPGPPASAGSPTTTSSGPRSPTSPPSPTP